jgi:hypothetical protein
MYLTLAGIKWPLKPDEKLLATLNFRMSNVQQYMKEATWDGVTDDVTDAELLDACGVLNEHFRNEEHNPSAGILCLSAKAGIVPNMDFIIVPIKCSVAGVWCVFAYESTRRLLYVSNNSVEYSTVSMVVEVLRAHTGSSDMHDIVSLNCDNAHNGAAASLVLMLALLKSWGAGASISRVEDYITLGQDMSKHLVRCRGRQVAYADVLPSILRSTWAPARIAPAIVARPGRCAYNDMFDLV